MKRNSFSINNKENKELYGGEEIDFLIDTYSNLKESSNNSDKSSDNNMVYIPRNINVNTNHDNKNEQMVYKRMNRKEQYIKSLEQKIKQQENQIAKLIDYKNLCESTIKQLNPLISLPLKGSDISDNDKSKDSDIHSNYINESYIINNNKKKGRPKKLNLSFNENYMYPNISKKNKFFKNRAKSVIGVPSVTSFENLENDKYEKLYSKYIKVLTDFKNLSNNSVSNNEYTRLKTQLNELKNKNNNLLRQIENEKNKSNDEFQENETIKNLKEQAKTFREELVLSQAMVNSLRAEIEQYNKNNPNKYNKDKMNQNFGGIDSYVSYNYNNHRKVNQKLKEENDSLKCSLKNNSLLLKKVLEENNRLRDNEQIQNSKIDNNLKDKLTKYEDKFDYFNDYINNIKNQINILFNDLKSIIYNLETSNMANIFSHNFINRLCNLRKDFQKLKKIDRFNLDSSDDEECLKQYMNLVKLLLNGLEEMKKNLNLKNNNNNKHLSRNTNCINNNLKLMDNINKYLKDILVIIKNKINENGVKQLIADALNIVEELSNLYKNRKNTDFNDVNEQINEKEKELEYIKRLLLNQKPNDKNSQLTYSMNSSSPRIPMNIKKNNSGYYFEYQ